MAEVNRPIGIEDQATPVTARVSDSVEAAPIRKSSRSESWMARLLISMVLLPLPLFTAFAAIIRPQFEANLNRHDTPNPLPQHYTPPIISSAFALFLILVALFAYHAFMFWYNPFVDDDTALAARKEKVVNGVSLALSIPGLGGLALALFTGSSTNGEVTLIQQLARGFPLQTWAIILLLTVAVGWLGWWLYRYTGWGQRLQQRPRQAVGSGSAWQWLVRQFKVLQAWVGMIRHRAVVLISSSLSVGLLMYFLVSNLLLGLGNIWALLGLLTSLLLIEAAGVIAVYLGSHSALGWTNGAMFVMLFGIERLTRGAAQADRPALSRLPAGLLALEVFVTFILLLWQIYQRAPRHRAAPPDLHTTRGT